MLDEGLRPRDAQAYLGVSRTTLARYVRLGYLNRYRTPGGHSRYSKLEVEALRANPPKPGRPVEGSTPKVVVKGVRYGD